jgi:acetyl-CoA carboxylase biotin carboxylase subunit
MFKKILIANRGEIALRVIRACHEMGIGTVAVYSAADRGAPHVLAADEAVFLGPPPPLESYLDFDRLVTAARHTGAEAIHPGYGFVSENPRFARRCEEEGLVFIGPDSRALALVGDKVSARKIAADIRVPLIPGMMAAGRSVHEFEEAAARIGFPVLMKASGGGGGKGMHIVRAAGELSGAIETSRREARSAFGDESVYLEKYIERPRHVEFQVLSDQHGGIVHLCERECSIQRRYQKMVEETPSVAVDDDLRRRMGDTAVSMMRATHYVNAGTVEFLLDGEGNYYFLEVNARIQVEHPITEMVLGLDLVKLQIRIAAGEPLPFRQSDLRQRGHAMECRIYAEDPQHGFLPGPGRILHVEEPSGPGIRLDSGIYSGMEVTPYYDPILAKLIVSAEEREGARRRMLSALERYVILGVPTTIGLLAEVMAHPEFAAGRTHTHFIEQYFAPWKPAPPGDHALEAALIAGVLASERTPRAGGEERGREMLTPWETTGKWQIGGAENGQ